MLSFPARALCSLVDSRNLMRALHIKLSLQDNNAKRAQRSKQKWQPETNFFCAKLFLCPFNCLFGVLYEKLNSCNWGWFILYTVDHTNCSKLPKLASFSQNKLTKKRKPSRPWRLKAPLIQHTSRYLNWALQVTTAELKHWVEYLYEEVGCLILWVAYLLECLKIWLRMVSWKWQATHNLSVPEIISEVWRVTWLHVIVDYGYLIDCAIL